MRSDSPKARKTGNASPFHSVLAIGKIHGAIVLITPLFTIQEERFMTSTRIFARASFLVALFAPLLVWNPAGHTQNAASSTPTLFDKLRFREIGPATPGGRIDDFAVLESNPA